jgi:hypothetical protein
MSFYESNSAAAQVAREKFESRIAGGRASGAAIINKIMTEVPLDMIVRGRVLDFDGMIDERPVGTPTGIIARVYSGEDGRPMEMSAHPWAMQQICSRADVPWKYAQHLMAKEREGWGTPLVAHNLNEIYRRSTSKFLLRSHEGQLRGFLSDRYKRLDSRPLVEAFAKASNDAGAIPINGYGTDTKVGLTAVLPKIYEPVPNEPISFGVHWENSDYGNGRHIIHGFIDRAWCANGCIMSIGFAQVHLGRKLEDSLILSDRTHQLDTMTTASAIMDVVKQTLSDEMIQVFCNTVKDAHEQQIDPAKALQLLSKQMTKGEVQMVTDKFNSPDVEMLPPGNTTWRLSNAISWVAGHDIEDTERQLEMMKIAGAVLTMKQLSAARVR